MKNLFLYLAFIFCFFAVNKSSGQYVTFDNVPPLSGGGNTMGGVCFNFTTSSPISLDSLRCAFTTASGTATIWYHPNKINGQPTISAANGWISLGSASFAGLSPASTSPVVQTIPIGLGLTLDANDTIGLAIHWTGNVYPTTNVNIPVFTNGVVSIIADASCAFTFNPGMTSFFTPRQINGGVIYRLLSTGPNDAGLSAFTSPVNFCSGSAPQDIKVKIKNFGDSVLNSAQIHWELNGVAQTPYILSTSLDTFGGTGINELEVTLGSYVFTNTPVDFKAWSSLPNGVADTVNGNDTITRVLQASLSGLYTINSAQATGGTNFQSFVDFSTALDAYGVCGPVTANVNGGPFVEKIEFGNIEGSSATNTIRVNGNGAVVEFTNTSTERQLLTFNGTKYITIDSLTFKSLATDYGWAALITNGAAHDSIINCFFDLTSVTSVSSANTNGITFSATNTTATSTGTNGTHCYIGNNHVKWSDGTGGGYYALTLAGTSDSNTIENNIFENFYYYGTYINGATGSKIINNKFHKENKTTSLTTFYGIYSTGITPGTEISRNTIHHPGGLNGGSGSFYGIYILGDGTQAQPSIISNNLIYEVNQNGILYGIYLSTAPYTSVYHNTIVFDQSVASTSSTYGMYAAGTNTNSEFKNNNIFITGGTSGLKYGFYYSTATSIDDAQKNNIYLNSTQTGVQNYGYYTGVYATQAAFQAAYPLLELGSPTADPLFIAPLTGNFKVQNPLLIGAGANLMGLVPIDIDGTPRSATPTIGAFEQAPTGSNNAGTIAFITPAGIYCSGPQSVSVSINNGGINNITSLKLNWTVDGVLQPQVSYNSTLVPITSTGQNSDTVTLGNAAISSGTPTIIKAWTSLPNGVPDTENNNDTISLSFQATEFIAAAASDTICSGGDAILTLTPNSGYVAGSLQWESSPNGTTWTSIPNSDVPTYTASNVTTNTYYRVKVGSGTNVCYSNTVQIAVINVALVSSTPGERCGNGTVSLSATGSPGTVINWYSQATGGVAIGTGSPFTTPSISATTTYYASAALGGGGTSANSLSTLSGGTNSCSGGVMFDIVPTASLNIDSFKALASGSGSVVKVFYRTGTYFNNGTSSAGWTLHETINMSYGAGDISIPLTTPISLIGGTTNGIYISYNSSYTNGTGPNQTFTNSDMTINGGYGLCSEFGGVNDPRIFNGTVYYSSGGCESPRVPVIATIKAAPTVNLGNDTIICPGTSITLDAGSGGTYLWNNNSTAQTLNVTAAGTYSVKVTGSNSCSKNDTIVITAGIVPTNNLSSTTDLCEGDTIALNAGNSGSTFLWNTTDTTQTINVSAAGTYDVTINSPDGCPLNTSTNVIERTLPIVNLGNDTAICDGTTITLNAGNTGMNYLWSTGASSQSINISNTGTYSVTVTSSYNCKGRDTINITNLLDPTVDAFNFADLSNEAPGKVKFTAVNPQNVTDYEWNFGDGTAVSTEASPTHTYGANGIYTVTLKVSNSCGESQISLTINIESVGISILSEEQGNFDLYPNPGNHQLTIRNNSDVVTMEKISIVNILGTTVYEIKTNQKKTQTIGVDGLASGVYSVKILTNKGTVIKKFEVIK